MTGSMRQSLPYLRSIRYPMSCSSFATTLKSVFVCVGLLSISAGQARGQQQQTSDLISHYQQVRTRQIATEVAEKGTMRLNYQPLEGLDTKAQVIQDKLSELSWNALLASLPDPLETFGITSIRLISKLESPSYEKLFSEADWAFMGSSTRSAIDTMKTADIRSRLQHHYGSPTRTLSELGYPDSLRREDVVQFEYWFIANGNIPVIVMDVNGPWDRGVVLAAEMKFRSKLELIKKTLLEQLPGRPDRKPFIDYYYNFDQRTWYLTGFDGASFFDQRIQRPELTMGRPSPSLISERINDN